MVKSITIEEYWKKIHFITDNNIFIRSGSCNKCGKCCWIFDNHPLEGGVRKPCKHLDGKLCSVHDQKAEICIIAEMNPIYPTICMVSDAVDTCGYSWIINTGFSRKKALLKFKTICETCYKYPCEYHHTIIKEIYRVLK